MFVIVQTNWNIYEFISLISIERRDRSLFTPCKISAASASSDPFKILTLI